MISAGQLEQFVVERLVDVHIIQILEYFRLVEVFVAESFVWQVCVAALGAAFEIKAHLLVAFVTICCIFHDDYVDGVKVS